MGFFGGSSWKGDADPTPRLPRCGKCGLATECFSPRMAPTGDHKRRVLLVAEAPGEDEDRQGIQLVGKAGQLLRKTLNNLGEDLDDFTKTNSVICRPQDNKILPAHIEACRPNLIKAIKKYKPTVIILLGGSAVKSLVPTEKGEAAGGITKWAGWTIPSHKHQAWICPTYHPSYILRMDEDPVLLRMFEDHLRTALSKENDPIPKTTVEGLKNQIECITSPRLAKKRLKKLAGQEGVLAFDYETTGLKPDHKRHRILSCSFCLDGSDTFAILVDESTHRLLSRVLRSSKLRKVASNLKYEERWTLAKLGHPVAAWDWDTMLAAHCLDNRKGICSVKFQAYIHFGVPNYDEFVDPYKECDEDGFNQFHKLDHNDLLEYNALDSLLEFMVMEKQKEMMGV